MKTMTKTKFWNVKDDGEAAELLLYGEISDVSWYGDEVTPKAFADDLKALGGKDLTVHVNSPGGDVFAAQAIYNQLKNYSGSVTMYIDGMAASAATIITCAGDRVVMPSNAIFMVHNPKSALVGYYDATELTKQAKTLDAVRDTIVNVYLSRVGGTLGEVKLKHMMDAETWLTADDALNAGFIDEIEDGATIVNSIEGGRLTIGGVTCELGRFANAAGLKRVLKEKTVKKEGESMDNATLLQKITDLLGGEKKQEKVEEPVDIAAEAVKAERARVAELDALYTGNPLIDSVINTAKANGDTAEKVKPYIDSLADAQKNAPQDKTIEAVKDIIADNMDSGAAGVAPSTPKAPAEEAKNSAIDEVVKMANMLRGGK